MSGTPSPSARPGSRLASRLVAGGTVLATFAGLAWADATGLAGAPPMAWLVPAVIAVAVGAGREAVRLAAVTIALAPALVPLGTVAIALAPLVGAWHHDGGDLAIIGSAAVACMGVIVASFTAGVFRYAPGRHEAARAMGSLAAAVTLGLPLAFMVALRLHPVASPASLVPLVSLIAVVKAGDIAAYAVGSVIGRHRMAPSLSPGKTWEGGIASLVASLTVAWLTIELAGGGLARPLGGWPAYGLTVGAAGMIGDLAESLVKRDLAAKDSGHMLGGMGGFLDLVDSLLLAAPVAWLLWTAV